MKSCNTVRSLIFATLVTGFNLGVAQAEPSASVEFRDLDLRKSQDVATLYGRIEKRAASVCKSAASPWDAGRVTFVKRCTAAAIDDAVARANVGALTALHETKVHEASKVAQNRD
jgi:UrcA family protein